MTDFALLAHPASRDHLAASAHLLFPDQFAALNSDPSALLFAFEQSPAYLLDEPLQIPTAGGGHLTGRMIVCSFLPEQCESPAGLLAAHHKVREALRLASEAGARIAGLGGFTSIVAAPRMDSLAQEFGLALTPGNALTAALALAQMDELLKRLGIEWSGQTVSVIGATGDIGRALALALAPRVRELTLIGRSPAKLETLRAELALSQPPSPLHSSTDPRAALEASIILAATSSPRPLLAESDLRTGTIFCDLGYPATIALAPTPRADTLIFSGGLAQTPFALPQLAALARLPAPDILFGCYAETIVRALAGQFESISGKDILALAQSHGFRPAPMYRWQTPISHPRVESFQRECRK